MPWFAVPPQKLQHLSLFGYSHPIDIGEHLLATHSDQGDIVIQKANPVVWLDDTGEAMQMGATSLVFV